ncbi:MAG: di-trans,poly-cis-decaprenylcistransferase [Rickettsiaceae bacterium]|nr:di-trans,poly-cis-decaprenylcistransferase [Rickettsiaceae bacterium]
MKKSKSVEHLAIIMDGNGRWASERYLPKVEGHRQGAESAKRIIEASAKAGVKYLTLYALSSENWLRPEDEVKNIVNLLGFYLSKEIGALHSAAIRLRVIGDLSKLSDSMRKKIFDAISMTKDNNGMTLCIAFGYGGRDEIIFAARKMIEDGVDPSSVNEDLFEKYLADPEMPDVDLMIRTSGERRISNFLLWQVAYAELYFSGKYWPDFNETDLQLAIDDFASRERNFGYSRQQG